jgi:hypothetical protein
MGVLLVVSSIFTLLFFVWPGPLVAGAESAAAALF